MAGISSLTDADFQTKVAEAARPVVLDFGAEWCGPCKALAPIIEEIAGEMAEAADFYAVDIAHAPEAAAQFGVMSVPTVVIVKNGEEVDRSVGFVPKSRLSEFITSHVSE